MSALPKRIVPPARNPHVHKTPIKNIKPQFAGPASGRKEQVSPLYNIAVFREGNLPQPGP